MTSSISSSPFSQDGRVDVVANDAGHRVTPTSVGWNDKELLTGLSAKQFAGKDPMGIPRKSTARQAQL